MKPFDEMNEDELWEEFSNSLIRDSAAPMTMNYDDSESIRKNGIRECVNRWRYRFQNNHCNDAISRAYAIELLEERFLELQKIKKIPGNEKQEDVQLGINWCINTIREMGGVVATTPVAVVNIDKSDMKELIDKKFDEFMESCKSENNSDCSGEWVHIYRGTEYYLKCPECGKEIMDMTRYISMNFCPVCGLKMKHNR